jgi:hypothetical protein
MEYAEAIVSSWPMHAHKRHEMRNENNIKDCVLKCAPTACCFKAKWLGSQSLYIQFQRIAALRILCVKGRCIRDGRPLERCDGLEVVMSKTVQRESFCSVCACLELLLVFFILSFCLYYVFFAIFQLIFQFSAFILSIFYITNDILVTEYYGFWKRISTKNDVFRLRYYLLTAWSTVLLEKLTGSLIAKKFPPIL